jgi:hypothetical protein
MSAGMLVRLLTSDAFYPLMNEFDSFIVKLYFAAMGGTHAVGFWFLVVVTLVLNQISNAVVSCDSLTISIVQRSIANLVSW